MLGEPPASLVFAARRSPWPLDNGGRIRANRLLTGLARTFDTTLVCPEHAAGSEDGSVTAEELRAALPRVEVLTVPGLGPHKRVRQAAALARTRSFAWGRYSGATFAATIDRAVRETRAGIVHFDDLGAALNGPVPGVRNVYSAHNVERRVVRSERQGSAARRVFSAFEERKVTREEQGIWRQMDLCLAVSELDAAAMLAGGAARVEICPNGTDPVTAAPLPPLGSADPLRMVFVGSGGYRPYERGLAWFVTEVLPRLRAQADVRFDVVGEQPTQPVQALGVRYLGRVPAVAPHYAEAHVVIVPVFEGSGTRLKVVEAVGHGRPVVSTALGAEGLPLDAGAHYLQAEDAEGFAAAILRVREACRERSPWLEQMLADARSAIEPLLWPAIVARLARVYRAELGWS